MKPGAPEALARAYFRPAPARWWRWSADGTALEWRDGRTIAMTAQVMAVLKHVAPDAWPPFDALVLLLAACRESLEWNGYGKLLSDLMCEDFRQAAHLFQSLLNTRFNTVREGLEKIAALPQERRAGPASKALLAQILFERQSTSLPNLDAASILRELERGFDFRTVEQPADAGPGLPPPGDERGQRWLRTIQSLYEGLTRFDPAALPLREKTGLDQLVKPAAVEVPPVERVRGLLQTLEDDPELGGLTRLAKNLMAAVHLPHPLFSREDLPLGGVSDIANRGPLDRLLVSELANDDLTLAVRVALNEALYLRRETPPRNPHRRRALLIDTGIRLWGVPRVFATAVALALAATADAHAELQVFRTRAGGIEPADLTTRAGLIEQLAALETAAQPGPALRPFLEAAAVASAAAQPFRKPAEPPPLDAIVITHRDCLADARFRQCWPAGAPFYCAAVAQDGAFGLFIVTPHGCQPMREARLRLDDVLTPPATSRKAAPLQTPAAGAEFPRILFVEPFPLLLPHDFDVRQGFYHQEHGTVVVANDGRLLHWPDARRGARQLTARLPQGRVRCLSITNDGVARLLLGTKPPTLVTADLSGGECAQTPLTASGLQNAVALECGGALLLLWGRTVSVYDWRTGEGRAMANAPAGARHERGRFYRQTDDPNLWFAAAWDGVRVRFEPFRFVAAPQQVLAVFDREGLDGPWAVLSSGKIVAPILQQEARLQTPPGLLNKVIAISQDGHRLWVEGQAMPQEHDEHSWYGPLWLWIDLKTGQVYRSIPHPFLEPELDRFNRQHRLRKRARGVQATRDGGLALLASRKHHVRIAWEGAGKRLTLQPLTRADAAGRTNVPFVDAPSPPGTRFWLRVAKWAGGHRVFLDSRGLLHLKSADADVPETTLVLCDHGEVAGWCGDGAVCGGAFFLREPQRSDPAAVFANIQKFVARLS